MKEQPQPDPVPADEPPPHPAEPLQLVQIDIPVIQMQDLEHDPQPTTRVSNKGVRIEPHFDSSDSRGMARKDQSAIEALEELEESLHGQLPG